MCQTTARKVQLTAVVLVPRLTAIPAGEKLNLHLPLDVVLQQVLVHRVKFGAAHVVIVVGDSVAVLLSVGSVFHVVGLVAVVVVIVAFTGGKKTAGLFTKNDSNSPKDQ